jgi:hypothetical protein
MNYPAPYRSGHRPNFVKTPENDILDLCWAEGVLSDGRPFRAECWCQDQVTMLTFFVSTTGLEAASQEELADLLVREGLVQFASGQRYVDSSKWLDDAGNEMWSINVVVGDEDSTFVSNSVSLYPYNRPREEKPV